MRSNLPDHEFLGISSKNAELGTGLRVLQPFPCSGGVFTMSKKLFVLAVLCIAGLWVSPMMYGQAHGEFLGHGCGQIRKRDLGRDR